MTPLRCVQIGLGPIGRDIVARIEDRADLELVAALDRDPALVGSRATKDPAITVAADLPQILAADVAFVTTSSRMTDVLPVLKRCIDAGLHVVSTCEELAYPWVRHPDEARLIHDQAEQAGVVIIGGGINPGYLMDALPALLRWPMTTLRGVQVRRVVDTGRRRVPLQRKTGAGLSPAGFAELAAEGGIGHQGLVESADLLAAALGGQLTTWDVDLQPVIAARPGPLAEQTLEVGQVAGQHQVLRAGTSNGIDIELDLMMAVTVTQPFDEVRLIGDPDISWRADGGIDGDIGTVGAILQLAPAAVRLEPGLRTMLDLLPGSRFDRVPEFANPQATR